MNVGDFAELIVKHHIEKRGFYVEHKASIAADESTFFVPSATCMRDRITLPDLQAFARGRTFNIEVKCKQTSSLNRINNRLEHGIDWPTCESMMRYEEETGIPVVLAILELNTWRVRQARLSRLIKEDLYNPEIKKKQRIMMRRKFESRRDRVSEMAFFCEAAFSAQAAPYPSEELVDLKRFTDPRVVAAVKEQRRIYESLPKHDTTLNPQPA